MTEQIEQRLEKMWETAVRQRTVHIRPIINTTIAELPSGLTEGMSGFVEEMYRRSDKRVDLWVAFISHGSQSGSFGFRLSTAQRLIAEGYAFGDDHRQRLLKEIARKCEEQARREHRVRLASLHN